MTHGLHNKPTKKIAMIIRNHNMSINRALRSSWRIWSRNRGMSTWSASKWNALYNRIVRYQYLTEVEWCVTGKALSILANKHTAVVAICLTWDGLKRHETQLIINSKVTNELMSLNWSTSIPCLHLAAHSARRYWLKVNGMYSRTVISESNKKRDLIFGRYLSLAPPIEFKREIEYWWTSTD